MRLDGVVTSPMEVGCGTPQGLLWSPIIYLLYLAELLLLRPGLAFGYADDLFVMRQCRTLEENADLLAEDARLIL